MANSKLLKHGLDSDEIFPINDQLQVTLLSLLKGKKYLGYLIKPNGYRAGDWLWLLKRFDTKIKHWCWRWLSLGGQLILAKSILENLAVYWLSLCKIPKSILNTIKKKDLYFSLVWITIEIPFGKMEMHC